MKKNGFTLVEVLIALTIVATVAAVTAPLVSNFIPDKDKVLVLKAYKTLMDINDDLLSDKSLYLQEPLNQNEQPCVGLECTQSPSNPEFRDNIIYQGDSKYRELLKTKMEATDENDDANGNPVFSTPDGILWIIEDRTRKITIDVDRNNNDDCTFEDDGCDKVDRFVFNVTPRGHVLGDDALTRAYLANPDKLSDRKHDYNVANNELYSEEEAEGEE